MGMEMFPVIFIVFLLPNAYSPIRAATPQRLMLGPGQAPQLISFNDGKLGVNFAGYHAAVGLGGLLGKGATGGLYAEAGTPHGQSAKAGLGGAIDANGGTAGGLYAGATAGGNVKAGAGLAGGVNGGTSAGTGFAAAQAGNRYSSSTLTGGNTRLSSNGPVEQNDNNVLPTKNIATNELIPPVGSYKLRVKSSGVINNNANVIPNQEINGLVATTIEKNDSPQLIQKRIDIGSENVNKDFNPTAQSIDQISYRKEVSLQRNPTFFEDIFNIPIAALTAVRTFLTNTAGNTSISLQKSGSVHAETDLKSPKHASPSVKSSDTQISVKTPNASQLLDDIIAIPINTLGAVNKFLENNVPVRKRVTIQNGDVPPVRYPGRHARRRAFKKEIVAQEQKNDNLDITEATK